LGTVEVLLIGKEDAGLGQGGGRGNASLRSRRRKDQGFFFWEGREDENIGRQTNEREQDSGGEFSCKEKGGSLG